MTVADAFLGRTLDLTPLLKIVTAVVVRRFAAIVESLIRNNLTKGLNDMVHVKTCGKWVYLGGGMSCLGVVVKAPRVIDVGITPSHMWIMQNCGQSKNLGFV